MKRAVTDFGQTIVMVTHDPIAASYATASCSSSTAASSTRCANRRADAILDKMRQLGD